MNAATRKRIADALIAVAHGAEVLTRDDRPQYRSLYINLKWPGAIQCSFDIDDLHKGGILFNFHRAERPLRHHPCFDSINTVHYHKATTYAENAGAAVIKLDAINQAIQAGEIFQ